MILVVSFHIIKININKMLMEYKPCRTLRSGDPGLIVEFELNMVEQYLAVMLHTNGISCQQW